MTRRLLALSALVCAGFTGWAIGADDDPADIPACAREDSRGPCRWDARTQGNGRGTSFVIDADQRVTYQPAAVRGALTRDVDRWHLRVYRDGYRPLGRPVDGHRDCWIKVGPTSHLRCLDGFRSSS